MLRYRAKIELRANVGRISFTARSGFTQASGIAPLRELKLLLDETHDRDIDSNSFSLVRSTIYLGRYIYGNGEGNRGGHRGLSDSLDSLSDQLYGGGILLQRQARGLDFHGYKGEYRVLRGQGEESGLDIWVMGGLG